VTARAVVAGMNVAAARRLLAARFRDAGLDTPELDARLLTGHALGLDHAALVAADPRPLSEAEARRLESLATRRLSHEPVARIRGRKEFWSIDLRVTPDVLDPRPETETLVEAALSIFGERRGDPLRIADLGTGSGALLIALLHELPRSTGIGTDLSLAALGVARDNAKIAGVLPRAGFVACDYGTALAGGFDIIVTNPPYIRTDEIPILAREVRDFDPIGALDGGADGLDAYRAIAADAGRLLALNGRLIVECGHGQADTIALLFGKAGLVVPHSALPDLSSIPRALVAMPNDFHSLNRKKALGKRTGSD
jgi:release factor glutamine methyltransferase